MSFETNGSNLVTNRKPYQGIVTRQVLRLRSLHGSRILVNTWPTNWIQKHGIYCPHESSLNTSLNPKAQFVLGNQTSQDICTPSPDASYLDHKLRDGCHRGCSDYVTCPQVDTFNHQKATIFHNNLESHKTYHICQHKHRMFHIVPNHSTKQPFIQDTHLGINGINVVIYVIQHIWLFY